MKTTFPHSYQRHSLFLPTFSSRMIFIASSKNWIWCVTNTHCFNCRCSNDASKELSIVFFSEQNVLLHCRREDPSSTQSTSRPNGSRRDWQGSCGTKQNEQSSRTLPSNKAISPVYVWERSMHWLCRIQQVRWYGWASKMMFRSVNEPCCSQMWSRVAAEERLADYTCCQCACLRWNVRWGVERRWRMHCSPVR